MSSISTLVATPARTEIRAGVAEHDVRSIVARIVEDAGVSRDTAERWFDEMLRFLMLAAGDDGPAPVGERQARVPSPAVDEAWHAFILHTPAYAAYCRTVGRFVHHQPTSPDADASERLAGVIAYWGTRVAMRERYGELDESLWPDIPGQAPT